MKLIQYIAILLTALGSVASAQSADSDKYTFVMIHFEAGYQARLQNHLPMDFPEEYLNKDLGWQEYLFETAEKVVEKADEYGFRLTLAFNPQWAEYILLDSERLNTVRQWQAQGHEIAFHHHSLNHVDWNGYSNDPSAASNQIPLLGNVDDGLDFVRDLAAPANITTAMVGGLPVDMPRSFRDATENLIFASGSQFSSFEQYGKLRSLKPYKVVKANGAEVVFVTHRQLTTLLRELTIEEALEIFKTEYSNMLHEEVFGIVFHSYDYHEAEDIYTQWFDFINKNGDTVRTVSEIVADYAYDIPVK